MPQKHRSKCHKNTDSLCKIKAKDSCIRGLFFFGEFAVIFLQEVLDVEVIGVG
jgi:hypothetical protein